MADTADASDGMWDLSSLYPARTAPELQETLADAQRMAKEFRERYRGKISTATAGTVLAAVKDLERLHEMLAKPMAYAHLQFATASGDGDVKRFHNDLQTLANQISRDILFFDVEIMHIPEETIRELETSPEFGEYRHYVESLLKFRNHMLPEREEELLTLKKLSGRDVLVRLFQELLASLTYRISIDGEERQMTGQEVLTLSYSADRALREQGMRVFMQRQEEHAVALGAIFDGIILDHAQEMELRGYADPMQPTNLGNELSDETITHLLDTAEANYPLAQEYFRLKGRILGLEPMMNYDVYAPYGESARTYTVEEARQTVVEAFGSFDPEFADIADQFFSERRIDLFPRVGKSSGAFCMGAAPSMKPYVLVNFTGRIRDIATIAHEIGHGIHFTLARQCSMLNYHPPLPLAEVASVFGELILTRYLFETEQDEPVLMQLLGARIEDMIGTTMRQTVITKFEHRIHLERRNGLLTPERLCAMWHEENARFYGGTVEMIDASRWGWSYIRHMVHTRFYCYSYVFAHLLALALFRRYEEEGAAFVPKHRQVLASGGSLSPADTAALAGVDITAERFWQGGFDVLREMIDRFGKLAEHQAKRKM